MAQGKVVAFQKVEELLIHSKETQEKVAYQEAPLKDQWMRHLLSLFKAVAANQVFDILFQVFLFYIGGNSRDH